MILPLFLIKVEFKKTKINCVTVGFPCEGICHSHQVDIDSNKVQAKNAMKQKGGPTFVCGVYTSAIYTTSSQSSP